MPALLAITFLLGVNHWLRRVPGHLLEAPALLSNDTVLFGIGVNQPHRAPVGWIMGVDRTWHRKK